MKCQSLLVFEKAGKVTRLVCSRFNQTIEGMCSPQCQHFKPAITIQPLIQPVTIRIDKTYKPKLPGDKLHWKLQKWFRVGCVVDCKCPEHIQQMNSWGVVGCKQHLTEIVEWIDEAVHERKSIWRHVPFLKLLIKLFILHTIT